MTNQAKVLETRVAYDGRIFQAVVEEVRLPARDNPATVEIVRHAPSVVILAMSGDDRVMLVRQYRHAVRETVWELPAGSVDPGETPEAAARRECHEELGVIAGDVTPLGRMLPLPGYCTEEMHFFRIAGTRPPGPDDPAAHQDEDEQIEVGMFPLDRVRQMVRGGEIRDLKTAAALVLIGV
jgi:ADP-ribose pyrophosphatase